MRLAALVPCLVAALLVLVGGPAWCQETVEFPTDQGIDVGAGFDVSLGVRRMSPFVSVQSGQATAGGGQTALPHFEVAESSQHLEEITRSGKQGGGSFVFFSSSKKMGLLLSSVNDSYSLNAVAYNTVVNRETILTGMPQLSSSAKQLLAMENGIELFHKAHGDRFVFSITTGGEYYGVYSLKTSSDADSSTLTNNLKSSILGWGSGRSFEETVQSVSTARVEDMTNVMIGGRSVTAPSNMAGMVNLASTWSAVVDSPQSSVPIAMNLNAYDCYPEYLAAVARAETLWSMSPVMTEMGFNFYDFAVMGNTVAYILANPLEFRYRNPQHKATTLATLAQKKREIDAYQAALRTKRNAMAAGSIKPETYDALGIPRAEVYGASVLLPPRYRANPAEKTKVFTPPTTMDFTIPPVAVGTTVPRLFSGSPSVVVRGHTMMGQLRRCRVESQLVLEPQGKWVTHVYTMTAQEESPSWPTFERKVTQMRLPAPNGTRIVAVSPSSGKIEATQRPGQYGEFNYQGPGVVARVKGFQTVIKNPLGLPGGTRVKLDRIEFRPVTVTLVNEEDYLNEPYAMEQYFPTPAGTAAPVGYAGAAVTAPKSGRLASSVAVRKMTSAQLLQAQLKVTSVLAPAALKAMPAAMKAGNMKGLERRLKVLQRKTAAPKVGAAVKVVPRKAVPVRTTVPVRQVLPVRKVR